MMAGIQVKMKSTLPEGALIQRDSLPLHTLLSKYERHSHFHLYSWDFIIPDCTPRLLQFQVIQLEELHHSVENLVKYRLIDGNIRIKDMSNNRTRPEYQEEITCYCPVSNVG
jgi:hypothetical protein